MTLTDELRRDRQPLIDIRPEMGGLPNPCGPARWVAARVLGASPMKLFHSTPERPGAGRGLPWA